MSKLYKVLNPGVAKSLSENRELALVFYATFGHYDDEIEPLHNPDWVRAQFERESRKLEQARENLDEIRSHWLKKENVA